MKRVFTILIISMVLSNMLLPINAYQNPVAKVSNSIIYVADIEDIDNINYLVNLEFMKTGIETVTVKENKPNGYMLAKKETIAETNTTIHYFVA